MWSRTATWVVARSSWSAAVARTNLLGAVLRISGNTTIDNAFTLARVEVATGVAATLSGVIGGSAAGLNKTGAGALTLSAANTRTGATEVWNGTLTTTNGNAIDDASAVTVNADGTLVLSS